VTSLSAPAPAVPGTPRTPRTPSGRALPLTLGRRLALALGVPVAFFVIVVTSFSLVGDLGKASFPVSRALPVSGGHFTLNVGGGDVDLRGTPVAAGTARLTGTVAYSLVRPKVYWGDGSGAAAGAVRLGCSFWSMAECVLNAHVDLPAATVVNASTDGGNVSAADLSGAVTVHTGGGDVSVSRLSGPVSVTTSGGNVSADQVSGIIRLRTGGGDITGTHVTARDVSAETSGGNVGLTLTAVPANVDVRTGGGDVTIIVPPGVSYNVDARTGGGDVNDAVARDSSSPYKITVVTSGGNITVENSAA
jgi:hypothetical protein